MTSSKSIYYPPGGLLIWIVIYLELITFGMATLALAYYGSQNRAAFHADSFMLNKTVATINTIVLLTSGYFVAIAIKHFKAQQIPKTLQFLTWAILCGTLFLGLKGYEYYEKIEAGLTMGKSDFFNYYWLLTGFHWLHVLVGIVILLFFRFNIAKKLTAASLEDFEAGAAFWHMCDLIWLFLFPILYLLF